MEKIEEQFFCDSRKFNYAIFSTNKAALLVLH